MLPPVSFRELFEQIMQATMKTRIYSEVLIPWHAHAVSLIQHLQKYGNLEAIAWRLFDHNHEPNRDMLMDLYELYAWSRINDLLILPFQHPGPTTDQWVGPAITPEERTDYLLSLNLRQIHRSEFHPFFHEIVEVEPARSESDEIQLIDEVWPGFMLGQLMLCRAGVRVVGGTAYIQKEIAENTTLYWAYRRRNRPVTDLSDGWGSNSQWRTAFRRDYEDNKAYYYNVDGKVAVHRPRSQGPPILVREELTPEERIELLVHRCFIVTAHEHRERWPWHDTYTEYKRSSQV